MAYSSLRTNPAVVALMSLLSLSGVSARACSTAKNVTHTSTCPPFNHNGTITIDEFQLYPENGKYDPARCLVYFGSLFNASVSVYDPYKNAIIESITIPGLSGDPTLHLGPAVPDQTGRLSILFDAGAAFDTAGEDVSGSNIIIKYDFDNKEILWQHNITAEITHGLFGGFQDIEHDRDENVYVVGTYPGTIMRVDKDGKNLTAWYLPDAAVLANTTYAGFGGLASIREEDFLLSNHVGEGEIYRFDSISTSTTGTPVLVPRTDANGTASAPFAASDAILLPAKYNNTILLISEDAVGVTVLRSKDGKWTSAETLGTVSNDVPEALGGDVPATVQIGNQIYMVEEFFADTTLVPGTNAGNRTIFPLVDITAKVDALVAQFP